MIYDMINGLYYSKNIGRGLKPIAIKKQLLD